MYVTVILIILASGVLNMSADILMVSGKNYKNKQQTIQQRIQNTPDKHLLYSGLIGVCAIVFWVTPIVFLAKLPTAIGTLAFMSFAMYIVSLSAFHVMVAYTLLCYKLNSHIEKTVMNYLKGYGLVSIVLSASYTFSIIYLAYTGQLTLGFIHFITLPLFSMIIVQFILGNLLKNVPHFSSVAGTLGMMISFLSTVHFMMTNHIV